ncbi:MAG: hypothetical protein LBV53_01985 [Mycoplasmataceae bacterium]|jgi:hypothetical protein|nr:hypothetical protein [Mycoplasmataceae bacterium]
MKNNKTFKYQTIKTQELDRIRLEPTENINLNDISSSNDEDFESLSSEILEYKLENVKLTNGQKKQIKKILKGRK